MGNLASFTNPNGGVTTYTYDKNQNVTSESVGDYYKVTYTYDEAGNVKTMTNSVSDELSRVLSETTTDVSGKSETIRYTYGNGLIAQEKREAQEENDEEVQIEYLLYHFDHLGSTTAVTDENGAVRYTYAYNIYGKLLGGNYGEVAFLYNGQYGVMSDDNGLYYMRARYYNVDIMRFINQDILTGSIDGSQSLNRYAYVEGNPVNFLDPFGLSKDVYDRLYNWADDVKSKVSYVDAMNSLANDSPRSSLYVGFALFFVNTFVTWFDYGVSVSEWLDAAFEMDADRMMEINREVADNILDYFVEVGVFALDIITKGSVSLYISIAGYTMKYYYEALKGVC